MSRQLIEARIRRRVPFDSLSPFVLVCLFVIAGVVVPIYPFMEESDGFSIFWPYDYRNKVYDVSLAVVGYGLALLLFGLAYRYVSRRPRAARSGRMTLNGEDPMWPVVVLAIVGVTLATTVAAAMLLGGFDALLAGSGDRTRAFAGLNFLLLAQNSLISVGIAWALILSRRRERRFLSLVPFAVFCAFSIGVVAIQGSKATIFVFVFAMATIYHYRVRRLSLLKLLGAGALMFLILIAFHVFKQEYLVVGEVVSLDNSEALWSGALRLLGVQWTANLMELQCLATLIDGVPDRLDYQMGQTLLMILLIYVPSSLYAAKPLTAPGIFTNAFWPGKWDDEGTTMPPGYFGEMYMNFGWFGIALGAVAAGCLYGALMRKLRSNPECDLTLGKHAIWIAVLLHFFRGEVASVLLLFVSIYVPFVAICMLCHRRSFAFPVGRFAPIPGAPKVLC